MQFQQYLHSNKVRFKDNAEMEELNSEFYLHSNKVRFKVIRSLAPNAARAGFTFQ